MRDLPSVHKERKGAQVAGENRLEGEGQAMFAQDVVHLSRGPVSLENAVWDVSDGAVALSEKVTAKLGLVFDEVAKLQGRSVNNGRPEFRLSLEDRSMGSLLEHRLRHG